MFLHQTKLRRLPKSVYFSLSIFIADTGQNCSQLPHLIHFLGLISALPSTNLIAPTGQIEIQAPQEMHFDLSTITFSFIV